MKDNHQTLENVVAAALQKIIALCPSIIAVYLFGSFAEQRQTRESDLDLAILLPLDEKVLPPTELWNMAQEIAIAVNVDVDLIDMRQTSTVLNYQIVTKGKLIYCTDKKQSDIFFVKALLEYFDLNQKRAKIIADTLTA